MPDEDKSFGGSLVLDFRKWWRHVKTIYSWLWVHLPPPPPFDKKVGLNVHRLGQATGTMNMGEVRVDFWTVFIFCTDNRHY